MTPAQESLLRIQLRLSSKESQNNRYYRNRR